MNTQTTNNLTLENFKQTTGSRFRMTKEQTARVVLTEHTAEDRSRVANFTVEEASVFFGVKPNDKGKVTGWVKKAVELAKNWTDASQLTREGAFQEFVDKGLVTKISERKPEIPTSVWLEPGLTLENFEERVFKATNHRIRFRILAEQKERNLTREQALGEIIALKRAGLDATQA